VSIMFAFLPLSSRPLGARADMQLNREQG